MLPVLLAFSACSGGGPDAGDPTEQPPISDPKEWKAEFGDARADWQSAWASYVAEYSAFDTELNNWTPADGPAEDALAEATVGINKTLRRLNVMEHHYERLLPLVDVALDNNGIPEVASGQVSEASVRRYFEIMGDYIKAARRGLLASRECYSKSIEAAIPCALRYPNSQEGKDFQRTFNELDQLQFKLFGQHLNEI